VVAKGYPLRLAAGQMSAPGPRICVLTEYFYPEDGGGTGMVMGELCRGIRLLAPDASITVITSNNLYRSGKHKLATRETWLGIEIYRVNTPKSNHSSNFVRLLYGFYFMLRTIIMLFRLRNHYDVVLAVTNPPFVLIAAAFAQWMLRKPYVYLVHDLYPDLALALGMMRSGGIAERILSSMQRSWLHSAECVVVLGRCMKQYIEEKYAVPSEQICVVTNWSDAVTIPEAAQNTTFRMTHDLVGPLVLYAGNFGKYQNFDNILEAAKLLRQELPELKFVFVGDGAQREHMVNRLKDEAIVNCHLYPFVPREAFADLLASADVSLVTLEPGADGLGVPSKFYNILASGRPTVAILTETSEVALTLKEFDCGLQVDQGNPRRLADVIKSLVSDSSRLERMGRNARRAFEERFTLEFVARRYVELFRELTTSRTRST
jgi:colanic acid biosynthesis glycosyl transferase WcaI